MKNLKEIGLIHKYNIQKSDGTPVDENAEYFVLRLDACGSDFKHTNACRKAVLVYADEIKDHLPLLSRDLFDKYENIVLDTEWKIDDEVWVMTNFGIVQGWIRTVKETTLHPKQYQTTILVNDIAIEYEFHFTIEQLFRNKEELITHINNV